MHFPGGLVCHLTRKEDNNEAAAGLSAVVKARKSHCIISFFFAIHHALVQNPPVIFITDPNKKINAAFPLFDSEQLDMSK